MLRVVAAWVLVVFAVSVPVAEARSPLKAADMKTIRKDARAKARKFAHHYDAKSSSVTCLKRTPYSARCRIGLTDVGGGTRDCAITLVYVVTAANQLEGNVAHDGCASRSSY